jgi:hypothetical protein
VGALHEVTPRYTFGEVVVATLAAILSSMVAFVVGVLAGMFLGMTLLKDEAAAWSGVSMGIPIGLIMALVAGYWTWLRVASYGESKEKS